MDVFVDHCDYRYLTRGLVPRIGQVVKEMFSIFSIFFDYLRRGQGWTLCRPLGWRHTALRERVSESDRVRLRVVSRSLK